MAVCAGAGAGFPSGPNARPAPAALANTTTKPSAYVMSRTEVLMPPPYTYPWGVPRSPARTSSPAHLGTSHDGRLPAAGLALAVVIRPGSNRERQLPAVGWH
ncbi:hypothetical protein Acy02nite_73760 [Actinoplanes cyaneus]|uniref:Uncharacterized protein n=1 Tax=Actinoplanes cyaneus TaxID=52696 RepID=A0A919INU4_9ACTN|nr:hypothetical protein Acy02nite_73760 [Actinoplanes cyaneus]